MATDIKDPVFYWSIFRFWIWQSFNLGLLQIKLFSEIPCLWTILRNQTPTRCALIGRYRTNARNMTWYRNMICDLIQRYCHVCTVCVFTAWTRFYEIPCLWTILRNQTPTRCALIGRYRTNARNMTWYRNMICDLIQRYCHVCTVCVFTAWTRFYEIVHGPPWYHRMPWMPKRSSSFYQWKPQRSADKLSYQQFARCAGHQRLPYCWGKMWKLRQK